MSFSNRFSNRSLFSKNGVFSTEDLNHSKTHTQSESRFSTDGASFATFSANLKQSPVRRMTLLSGLFTPGILLMAVGLLTILFPRLFITIFAGFLLFVGALFCVVAWKFIQLRKKMVGMAREMEGRIKVQSVRTNQPKSDLIEIDGNKVIYH